MILFLVYFRYHEWSRAICLGVKPVAFGPFSVWHLPIDINKEPIIMGEEQWLHKGVFWIMNVGYLG